MILAPLMQFAVKKSVGPDIIRTDEGEEIRTKVLDADGCIDSSLVVLLKGMLFCLKSQMLR